MSTSQTLQFCERDGQHDLSYHSLLMVVKRWLDIVARFAVRSVPMPDSDLVESKPRHANQTIPALTLAKQRAFLKAFAETGIYKLACEAAHVDDSTPCQWANRSKSFAKKRQAAQAQGEKILLAQYESSLDDNLLRKHTSFDDFIRGQVLRMFRMKRLDPQYRDNATVNVAITGPAAISFGVDRTESGQAVKPGLGPTTNSGVPLVENRKSDHE